MNVVNIILLLSTSTLDLILFILTSKPNLIKIWLFILLSYEDLTAARARSCADNLYRLEIKTQLTTFRKLKVLKVACTNVRSILIGW